MFQILHYLTWLWWWVFLLFFGCMLINSSMRVLDWSISGSWAWLRHKCVSETSWWTCVIPCYKTEIQGCNWWYDFYYSLFILDNSCFLFLCHKQMVLKASGFIESLGVYPMLSLWCELMVFSLMKCKLPSLFRW